MIVYKIVSYYYNEYKSLYANYFQPIALTYKLGEITKAIHGPIFAYSKVWDWSEAYANQNKALMICETHDDALKSNMLYGVSDLDNVRFECDMYWGLNWEKKITERETNSKAKYAYCDWVKPIAIINDIPQYLDEMKEMMDE